MADAEFTVTDWVARRHAIQPNIAEMTQRIMAAAAAGTPRHTGQMAASWQVVPGRDPGTSLVVNTAPHAKYVEYGTRHRRAAAPLGRALAAAG